MQYYSSMTLADYVAANWTEMDPNLVLIIENEALLLEDAREEADAWCENYHDVLNAAEHFQRDLTEICDSYATARCSAADFLTLIRTAVKDVGFDL